MFFELPAPLQKKLTKHVSECSLKWHLIEENDRILIGYSGGKDSLLLIHCLDHIQRVAPVHFHFAIFHLNASDPDFPAREALDMLARRGIEVHCEHINMAEILAEKIKEGDSPCYLCSRLRRGILYTQATRLGFNKIALGHHRDDAIETLLMSALYAGQLKAMPARLTSDDGNHIIIRPLLYTPEEYLIEAAQYVDIPIVDQTFCHRGPDGQRAATKALLQTLSAQNPKIKGNLMAALHNVIPSHLLDKKIQ